KIAYLKDTIHENKRCFDQFIFNDPTESDINTHSLLENLNDSYSKLFSSPIVELHLPDHIKTARVKDLHARLSSNQAFAGGGKFRTDWLACLDGISFLAPALIEQTLTGSLDRLAEAITLQRKCTSTAERTKQALESSCVFAAEFYNIMPFRFGCDIMLRILLSQALSHVSAIPVILHDTVESAQEFRDCLKSTRMHAEYDCDSLKYYLAKQLCSTNNALADAFGRRFERIHGKVVVKPKPKNTTNGFELPPFRDLHGLWGTRLRTDDTIQILPSCSCSRNLQKKTEAYCKLCGIKINDKFLSRNPRLVILQSAARCSIVQLDQTDQYYMVVLDHEAYVGKPMQDQMGNRLDMAEMIRMDDQFKDFGSRGWWEF
ncbi:MAG: hypothetical protein ACRYGG_16960, partial [Janthinobacterium lividum]